MGKNYWWSIGDFCLQQAKYKYACGSQIIEAYLAVALLLQIGIPKNYVFWCSLYMLSILNPTALFNGGTPGCSCSILGSIG